MIQFFSSFILFFLYYFNLYYYFFFILLLIISSKYKLLKGKQFNSIYSLKLLHFIIFLFFWIPIYNYYKLLSYFYLLYLYYYLNLNQFYGKQFLYLRYYQIFQFLPNYFKNYFGCKLIKTNEINIKQCILTLHPHGLLPYCTLINIVTEVNQFSLLFPNLSNRVLVVASALFYIPFLRDFLLSYGLIDASRYNFERWLQKGNTVCVYVGGAHEALYANPDNDILDLKRKTGFMKLAMKYNIPIVPCYTFNEVNHHKQISFSTLLKYPILSFIRQFIHTSTGLCLPLITSWIPSSQTQVVTVVGKPLYYSKKKSIEKNMEKYINELKKLYDKYSPIYNSNKRKLIIYS